MEPLQIVVEPRRREILRLVWRQERTVGDIVARLDRSFGAVSQHLAILRDAGFVTVRRDGNRRYYRADPEALGDLRPVLEAMWAATLDQLTATIEADEA